MMPLSSPPLALQGALYAGQQFPPNPNPYLRCPIPPVAATADSLRQYYVGGLVPQNRIMTPATLSQGGGTSGGGTTSVITNTSVTSTTTVTTKVGTIQSASVTTPVINQNQSFTATLNTSTAFVPLTVSVSKAARVELYATKAAQSSDLLRPITTSPGPGTEQGLLLDVYLDTAPFSWAVTPATACANNDSPQVALSYITVTNPAPMSVAITVTVRYLILKV
jgi:hypothetical protein